MFTVYLSLISGYLGVTYLFGAKLSTFQALGLSALFIFGAGGQALGQYNVNRQTAMLMARLEEFRPLNAFEMNYTANGDAWVIAMVVGVLLSIACMWSVRHLQN
jgi:hypothetical protein